MFLSNIKPLPRALLIGGVIAAIGYGVMTYMPDLGEKVVAKSEGVNKNTSSSI